MTYWDQHFTFVIIDKNAADHCRYLGKGSDWLRREKSKYWTSCSSFHRLPGSSRLCTWKCCSTERSLIYSRLSRFNCFSLCLSLVRAHRSRISNDDSAIKCVIFWRIAWFRYVAQIFVVVCFSSVLQRGICLLARAETPSQRILPSVTHLKNSFSLVAHCFSQLHFFSFAFAEYELLPLQCRPILLSVTKLCLRKSKEKMTNTSLLMPNGSSSGSVSWESKQPRKTPKHPVSWTLPS